MHHTLTCVCVCVRACVSSHQGQQAGVEEDVALGDVHAAEQLPEVGAVVQRHVGRGQQHVAFQHAVQVHRQQLHALGQDQLQGRGRELDS